MDQHGAARPVKDLIGQGVAALFVAIGAVPLAYSAWSLRGRRWVPVGDQAVMRYRIEQVGGVHTPLVGVYSTHGWAHPGPAIFWLLAGPYRLAGSVGIALFVTAALFNLAVVVAIGVACWRKGGLALVALGAAIVALLIQGLRPELLVDIWNPFLGLLLYFFFLLACWCLTANSWRWLPVVLVVGSVLIQFHVAYVPLVMTALVATAAWLLVTRGRRVWRQIPLRAGVLAIVLPTLVWLPTVVDALVGQHNVSALARYFVSDATHPVGLARGAGILSIHLPPSAPWSGAHERTVFANVIPGTLWPLFIVLGLLVGLGALSWRRGKRGTAALLVVALSQVLAGVVAASRVEEPILNYLVVWMLPLTAFVWFALAWAAFDVIVRPVLAGFSATRTQWLAAGSLVALAVSLAPATATSMDRASEPPLPRQELAPAVASLVPQILRNERASRIRVEWRGDLFNESGPGIIYGLLKAGRTVFTTDGAEAQKWGAAARWNRQSVGTMLTLAVNQPLSIDDPVAVCAHNRLVHPVAAWDQLNPADRKDFDTLRLERYLEKTHFAAAKLPRYNALQKRSLRIVVFAGPVEC